MELNKVEFYKKVYEIVDEIPKGKVATYGQIAFLMDRPQNSRLVGQALSHAPTSLNIACHRVVNSQGCLVKGWTKQKSLLLKEGVNFKENGNVDLKKSGWGRT